MKDALLKKAKNEKAKARKKSDWTPYREVAVILYDKGKTWKEVYQWFRRYGARSSFPLDKRDSFCVSMARHYKSLKD